MIRTTFRPPPALWFATAFLLLGLIIYLSVSRTIVQIPGDDGGRYGHFAAYAALMFMFSRIYATTRWRLTIGATLVLIGAGLEFVQASTGYRTFEYADIVANAIGVALGLLAERTLTRMMSPRQIA